MDRSVTVIAGGVGAARYLRGLLDAVPAGTVTAVVNTGDDTVLHGLHVSPDLDTITYTLAGAIDAERGWGLADETWRVLDALERYVPARPAGSAAATTWFRLGDQDLATHLYRTHRLGEGATLTEVTAEITRAWGLGLHLLPMTDDRVETRLSVAGAGELGFQEYFVRRRHSVPITAVRFEGVEQARPGPGVEQALREAGAVVIAPSNPVVSVGPVLAVGDIGRWLAERRRSVVAVSPIVGGAALKGPADRMLAELGHEVSVVGIARVYRDVAATLVIDTVDAGLAPAVEAEGVRCVVTDTVMRDPVVAAALARTTLEVAG